MAKKAKIETAAEKRARHRQILKLSREVQALLRDVVRRECAWIERKLPVRMRKW
jgi:hypothetical protein